ncbi:acyl transferase/acyl hydrolase/lysophospholipase [Ilyonectria robusta]|uniref:acyl transferase/acyl hydrolase/lysophospholipase n=1 Tax=Ilyonectria robusta TaxID=1079257 RepID=UPI001E8E144E|nr:acyl transferase/acyl hydrolase/lysophospholipase [Ilyonectria robusta]KAH8729863.1 acyl transferase/acyl hydrolase/lysophospholipase [Ilyonectria robusta]
MQITAHFAHSDIDGGGIRGLSELIILEQIMNRIKFLLKLDEDPLPADYFDLIGGTSTGGLIALLLGRLRLSVPQARAEFVRISEEVFSASTFYKTHKFDARKLEDAVKRLLGDNRSEERMNEKDDNSKVFVCSVPQTYLKERGGPRLFRTYSVLEKETFNCTIWEACRATSAAPTYFDPIYIGDKGEKEPMVDGGLGYNNPVEQVLQEARNEFPGRKVACVVSIGTGVANAIKFPKSPKTSFLKVIKALTEMATESDTIADKIQERFRGTRDTYFRFSVDHGLAEIGLEEWKNQVDVRTKTTEYINQRTVLDQVMQVATALLASKIVGGGDGENKGSQGQPRMLEWRPSERPIPKFPYTTEQLALQSM